MPEFDLTLLDGLMVGLYVVVILGVGFYFSRYQDSTADYFLAGRSLTWGLIGLSLFATNMSTSSLVGLAGDAYAYGIAVYNYEWMAVVVLILFAVFFLPVYLRSRVFTMPEFLERRYDARVRYYFSLVTIVGNITIDTAGALYAGALIIQILLPGFPVWQAVVVLAILSGLYTITGGLTAVVYTDAIQTVLLIAASTAVSIVAFNRVGSWEAVTDVTPPEMLSLIQPIGDPVLPWPGLLTGVFLLGFYFWATNQFIVQRTLAAKNLDHGQWGVLFAGLLKLPVLFIMILPGTFARALYGPEALVQADKVLPTMMFDLLPVGVRGLVLAALIAAIMSSVDSTLNAASTLVTMDFVKKFRPNASSRALVFVGRSVTAVLMLLAALWAPLIVNFPSLWQYLQTVLAYLSPPVVACFVLGLFWARANKEGAFAGLVVGHLVAITIAIAQWQIPGVALQFLYVPPIVCAVSAAVLVGVSLTGEPPGSKTVAEYTWRLSHLTREFSRAAQHPWYKNFYLQSVLLLLLTSGILVVFW